MFVIKKSGSFLIGINKAENYQEWGNLGDARTFHSYNMARKMLELETINAEVVWKEDEARKLLEEDKMKMLEFPKSIFKELQQWDLDTIADFWTEYANRRLPKCLMDYIQQSDINKQNVSLALSTGKYRAETDMPIGMQELTNKIEDWSIARGLNVGDPKDQFIKLAEELGELANGLARNDKPEIIDAIGDMYVVLTILAQRIDLPIQICVGRAYDEIKDRKGKMVDGIFIKEADLNE